MGPSSCSEKPEPTAPTQRKASPSHSPTSRDPKLPPRPPSPGSHPPTAARIRRRAATLRQSGERRPGW